MAKGSRKNSRARNKRMRNTIRNNKHCINSKDHQVKTNFIMPKHQIEAILFYNFKDKMLFYKKLPIQKQIIFCNCVQHIIHNSTQDEMDTNIINLINSTENT